MKTLIFSLLLIPFIAFAQDPSISGTSSPAPAGYIAGLAASGTSVWCRPLQFVPTLYGVSGRAPVFISGTTPPALAAVQLAIARRAAVRSLTTSYATALAAGVTVASGSLSLTLAAEPADQQQFNELLSLLNTAPMPPTLTITDIRGNPQTVTVAQYYSLIGSYGQQLATLWSALTTAKTSVASASGTAALSRITLSDPTGE